MQFDAEGNIIARVRWYFTKPGAKPLPFHTRFASGNWAWDKDVWFGPGEVSGAARPWRNGAPPIGPYEGKRFCGRQSWYEDGTPSDAPPLPRTPSGFPKCCRGGRGAYSRGFARDYDRIP